MNQQDYEFLLEHWSRLCEQLQDVNRSLRDLAIDQQETILKLQGVQTVPPKKPKTGEKL